MKKYSIFIIIIFIILSPINSMANIDYITILTFGEYGNGAGEFNYPVGIAIDKKGNLYVTDWENDRIQIFNSEGKLLKIIPSQDSDLKLDGPGGYSIR